MSTFDLAMPYILAAWAILAFVVLLILSLFFRGIRDDYEEESRYVDKSAGESGDTDSGGNADRVDYLSRNWPGVK